MELWDLYDNNLVNTGKVVSCEEDIPTGYYHLALELWIINEKHQVLLLKNTIDYSKRYPGSWCCIGGNLHSKENVEEAIIRIINEKIGITISLDKKKTGSPIKREPFGYAYITCILFTDIDTKNISFKDRNSTEAKYVDEKELIKMCNNGEIAYYLINRINNEVLQYMK